MRQLGFQITGREVGSDTDIEVITWTSGTDGHVDDADETSALKPHTVQLKPGNYVLHEEAAPDGYMFASDIAFTVKADGSVVVEDTEVDVVVMTDQLSAELPATGSTGTAGAEAVSLLMMAILAGVIFCEKRKFIFW